MYPHEQGTVESHLCGEDPEWPLELSLEAMVGAGVAVK